MKFRRLITVIIIFTAFMLAAVFPQARAEAEQRYFSNEEYLFSHIGYNAAVKSLINENSTGYRPKIAVIDSGVEYDLPDFLGADGTTRISPLSYNVDLGTTAEESGYEVIRDSAKDYHGTKVTGVIFATADNGVGVDGLFCGGELIAIKMQASEKGTYKVEQLKAALVYALKVGADVVNVSLGFKGENKLTDELAALIRSGAVVVASSGNDDNSAPNYPAANDMVLGVGAFENLKYKEPTSDYARAKYSCFGYKNVDVCAPGSMYVLTPDGAVMDKGTSFAAPVVTSLLAVYRALHPGATVEEIKSALYSSAVDKGDAGKDYYLGYGAVNFYNMLFGKFGEVRFIHADGTESVKTVCEIDGAALPLQSYPLKAPSKYNFAGWYYGGRKVTPYRDNLPIGALLTEKTTENLTADAFDVTFSPSGDRVIKGYYGNERTILTENLFGDESLIIAPYAFENLSGVKLSLKEGVKKLSEYALCGCEFEWLILPSTLQNADDSSVYNCKGNAYLKSGGKLSGAWQAGGELNLERNIDEIFFGDDSEIISYKKAERNFGCKGEISSGLGFLSVIAAIVFIIKSRKLAKDNPVITNRQS